MSGLKALLVEDDEGFASELVDVLRDHGFDPIVITSLDAFDAWERTELGTSQIDLVILDRQLPLTFGAPSQVDIGSIIFQKILYLLPDAPVIHLTGHSDSTHQRSSTTDRAKIQTGGNEREIDSVYYFRKSDFPEFEDRIRRLSACIYAIEDIELTTSDGLVLLPRDRRLLRRISHEFAGRSIHVAPMLGGLTKASVWLCRISIPDRPPIEVVAKASKRTAQYSELQQATNSSARIVAPMRRVTGLCYGRRANIYQLAGSSPDSLFKVIETDPARACDIATEVLRNLETAQTTELGAFEDLVTPFISWEELILIAEEHSVVLPRRSAQVTVHCSVQHGDLHPGNVLLVDAIPYVIDLDSEGSMSSAVDPLTMLWSPLFHPESPLLELDWPRDSDIVNLPSRYSIPTLAELLEGCPPEFESWLTTLWPLASARLHSSRDFWGLTMAYAARTLDFPDVRKSPELTCKALALFANACKRLAE